MGTCPGNWTCSQESHRFSPGLCTFLLFINNLDVQTELVTVVKNLADDMKLGQIVRNDRDREVLQENLNKMTKWARMWGMYGTALQPKES
jgi:hypothetical protein